MQGERQRFLEEQWPAVYATIQRLGLKPQDLLNGNNHRSADAAQAKGSEAERDSSSPSGTTVPHDHINKEH
jgi:GntR family transcriptional regulator